MLSDDWTQCFSSFDWHCLCFRPSLKANMLPSTYTAACVTGRWSLLRDLCFIFSPCHLSCFSLFVSHFYLTQLCRTLYSGSAVKKSNIFFNDLNTKRLCVHLFNMTTCISSLVVVACWCARAKYAKKLLTDLMSNYTKALIPVEDTNIILNVTLQVTLSQIIDMVTPQHMQIHAKVDAVIHIKMTSSCLVSCSIILRLFLSFSGWEKPNLDCIFMDSASLVWCPSQVE